MLSFRLVNTEGSLISNGNKNKIFYFLKKDPLNNYLWKTVKKGSLVEKNKKLYSFKQRILNTK
jgi:hypothetical protein